MNCEENEILDSYAEELSMQKHSYNMMGKMLDKNYIKKRLECWNAEDLVIYGGGYLGIQLYYAVKDFIRNVIIVDKSGGIVIECDDIPVISLEKFRSIYHQQRVIITPIKYYEVIKKELLEFVREDDILFLGEFLEGMI